MWKVAVITSIFSLTAYPGELRNCIEKAGVELGQGHYLFKKYSIEFGKIIQTKLKSGFIQSMYLDALHINDVEITGTEEKKYKKTLDKLCRLLEKEIKKEKEILAREEAIAKATITKRNDQKMQEIEKILTEQESKRAEDRK